MDNNVSVLVNTFKIKIMQVCFQNYSFT